MAFCKGKPSAAALLTEAICAASAPGEEGQSSGPHRQMTSGVQLKAFRREDEVAAQARDTFQAAMANDPIACYLAKGSSIRRLWDVMITQYLKPTQSELNFITEGANAAVLARVYPDEKASALQSFCFTLRMVPCVSAKRLRAALRMGDKMDSTKDAFGKEHGSYIYVFLLGARPEWQGRGLGSALLQHLNSIADAKGMHCYLESRVFVPAQSSSERSRRLYMRHGYVEKKMIKAAQDAPPMFLMSRAPSKLHTGTNGN